MSKSQSVILIRHAQSQWNLENRFTGWADPSLTDKGRDEARRAGERLGAEGYKFTQGYCSRLKRSRETLDAIIAVLGQENLPVVADWRLNERHYGSLQGNVKTPEANGVDSDQIWKWRRSYLDKAEPLAETDPRHPRNDELYSDIDPALLPAGENLAEVRARAYDCWQDTLLPAVQSGETILVSAHGNTLRGLLMALMDMSVAEVEGFEIPTGIPIALDLNDAGQCQAWRYLQD